MSDILDNALIRPRNKNMQFVPMNQEKRFFDKIDKTQTCWLWIGALRPNGYGTFWINNRLIPAHQASWILHHGSIPKGKWILHTCDIKRCVNPSHLYTGTIHDNARDAVERGRLNPLKGENHRDAKLTWIAVRAIRDLYKSGQWSYTRLGMKFGVSKSCIDGVVSRRHWKGDPNDL